MGITGIELTIIPKNRDAAWSEWCDIGIRFSLDYQKQKRVDANHDSHNVDQFYWNLVECTMPLEVDVKYFIYIYIYIEQIV